VTITQEYLDWLAAQRDDQRRQAAGVRRTQAKAEEGGLSHLAGSLGLLVMMIEKTAEHLDAEHRACAAKFKKQRGESRARDASKAARQSQADADAERVAAFFASAWRPGMGRTVLQATAVGVLRLAEQREQDRLATMQQAGNRHGARQASAALAALQRQSALLTLHRAGKWLQSHHPPPAGERQ